MANPIPLRPIVFPPDYSRGAKGGLGFSTNRIGNQSGNVVRQINYDTDLHAWSLAHLTKLETEVSDLEGAFGASFGGGFAFLFKWWHNVGVTREFIAPGAGDTSPIQLVQNYGFRHRGLVVAKGAASITLQAVNLDFFDHLVDDKYNGAIVRMLDGPAAGHAREITDYDGGTQIAVITPGWSVEPDVGDTYETILFRYRKPIVTPIPGTVIVYQNDVSIPGTLDPYGGTFVPDSATTGGAAISWTGSIVYPVTFTQDQQRVEFQSIKSRSWADIGVQEVRNVVEIV